MFELPIIHTRQTLNACGHCAARGAICAITDQCPSLASMPFNDGSLTWIWEMEAIGNHYGLPFVRDAAITLDKIRRYIATGFPVILLGQYQALNPGHSYDDNHWFCVKGVDESGFLINDSLRVSPVYVSNATLELSLANASPHHFALIPERGLQVVGGGMNLDKLHPVGAPDPSVLAGIPYGRLLYNVSRGTGSTDLNTAYQTYAPYLTALKDKGIAPILVLNHQTYGEGRNYNWEQMTPALWEQFTNEWIAFLVNVVHQWAGKGFVYQIWNEQDTLPEHARAAVPIPAVQYGNLFRRAYSTIKGIDTTAKVITGGHVNGAASSGQYWRNSGITQADGVACHPYGQGASSNPNYRPFGTIESYLNTWRQYTNLPLWITEFGVLDQPNEPLSKVIDYAHDFIAAVNTKVVTACWYAYGDTMDNGYGAATSGGNIKVDSTGRTLLDPFKVGGVGMPTVKKTLRINGSTTTLNFRSSPTTNANNIIGTLRTGTEIERTGQTANANNYPWIETKALDSGVWKLGWFAEAGATWTTQEVITTTTVEIIDL